MGTASDVEKGRAAYAHGSWRTAFEALARADEQDPLPADDLELWARAAYMLGRDDDYVRTLTRAHQAHLESGDLARGVRCGIWIGHSYLFRGQATPRNGPKASRTREAPRCASGRLPLRYRTARNTCRSSKA